MGSRFDDAWANSNEALVSEMGEPVCIGGQTITAVVDVAESAYKISGMGVNAGVVFTVFLTAAQVQELSPEKGAPGLQMKEVERGVFKGKVKAVRDLGGAGAELDVGPRGDR